MYRNNYNQQRRYQASNQPSQQEPRYNGHRTNQYEEHRKKSTPQQHTIDEVIIFCQKHCLNATMIGRWIWVQFTDKPTEQKRKLLKDFGFRWSKRREMWAHNCGTPSQPGNEAPWTKYPCYRVSSPEEADGHRFSTS